jgi:sec-independent protein translocase protein TatB
VGALDPAKILMILVIAMIVLGPERLPKVAHQLGAAWREVSKFREKLEAEVRSAIPDVDLPKIPTTRAGRAAAAASFLAGLTDTSKPLKANGNAADDEETDADEEAEETDETGETGETDASDASRASGEAVANGAAANGATTNGAAADALLTAGAMSEPPVGESLSASAERKMQQLAERRAKAIARAETRGAATATDKTDAPAATRSKTPRPAPAAPAQVGSGLADSPIGFDDPSMN